MKKKVFYVYQYVNRSTSTPFYVGKGKDQRHTSHLRNAQKGERGRLYDEISRIGFEEGVEIVIVEDSLTEFDALRLECEMIASFGRIDLGTGPLLNKTSGGEGISGGIDKYGYKRKGIARKITDMVDRGVLIQDMPAELREYVEDTGMSVKSVEDRIIPHLQEMGNVGCHYKGPAKYLEGWQFSLDGKMIDINSITLDTKGFLRVHGELPFNEGFVAGKENRHDEPPQETETVIPSPKAEQSNIAEASRKPSRMFEVIGTIPRFQGSEYGFPADNSVELEAFLKEEGVQTKRTIAAGKSTIKVRSRELIEKSRELMGETAALTIEVIQRSDGNRIKSVDVTDIASLRAEHRWNRSSNLKPMGEIEFQNRCDH